MIAIIAPSLDDKRIYPVHRLQAGAVHRSRVALRHASGKGANAARAAAQRGESVMLCAFAGGDFQTLLADQLGFLGVRLLLTMTRETTRSCVTVLEDGGRATEFVQEALPVEKTEVALFHGHSMHCIDGAAAVLLAGSLPPGLPGDFYHSCALRAVSRAIPIVIDAQHGALLAALPDSGAVVKINREEFDALRSPVAGADAGDDALAEALLARGARSVIVTDGPNPVLVWNEDGRMLYEVPAVNPVNPVGSGDAMSAGVTLALAQGLTMDEAVRMGIEMGAANARTLLPGDL